MPFSQNIQSKVLQSVNTTERLSASLSEIEMLEVAMHMAGAGYWALNFQTDTLRLSDGVKAKFSAQELKRIDELGIRSIMHKDDIPRVDAQLKNALETGSIDLLYRISLQSEGDREVWQRSRGRVQYDADGKPFSILAFVTDVTDDIKKQNSLALSEQDSKAKSDFFARMSHEIRTPLNAIIGMTDVLKDENLSSDALETVNIIDEAAHGLHQLLTQTLDHAKLISVEPIADWAQVDPKQVVADCVRLWRPQCSKKNLALKTYHGKDLPETMLIDSFKLGQCLNNLLSNAVKFTHAGEISIFVQRKNYRDQDSLLIAVRDTGIGMEAETASKVFEEFTQANTSIKREYGGTGLGMNITQRLVHVMKGQITVSSRKGEGSTFIIVLPIQKAVSQAPRTEVVNSRLDVLNNAPQQDVSPIHTKTVQNIQELKSDDEYPPFTGLSVLCVEDNPVNQSVVRKLIGKRVQQLHFASNGVEALKTLNTVNVDVVLMDIHMPVMDGIETTLAIRNSESPWANVVIIALTADPDYQQARICRNLGMDGAISKPVTRDDISYAFEEAISKIGSTFGQQTYLPMAKSS